MNLTMAIPVMNQLNDCKGILGQLRSVTSNDTEWLIVDNGSTDPYEDFLTRYLKPTRLNYIKNKENLGLVKTYQQMYENCGTDLIAFLHNDVFIYEKDWDKRVIKKFEEMPDLGAIGFFGAQGVGPIGERIQDIEIPGQMAGWSSMLEADVHGMRLHDEFKPAAVFDGFAIIMRMEILKKAGGIDQTYQFHHLYDRELGLLTLAYGYKNIVLNIPCHHWSGMTANRPEYQTWIDKKTQNKGYIGDKYTHDKNTQIFNEKWRDYLPIYIENDFSFRKGQTNNAWDFKGDKILGCLNK
jgi:glycosyltransferase involved in cell wall biosynthesis